MTFGDIYLVEIPASGGREQQGVRPAIIVQTVENIEKIFTEQGEKNVVHFRF